MNKLQMIELIRTHHPEASNRLVEMFIEMAANKIAEDTHIYKRSLVMSSVAGKRLYDFPKEDLRIDEVYFNDVKIPKLIGDPIIDDDEFQTNAEDTADTELDTPTANVENKRMWVYSPYKQYTEGATDANKEKEKVFARLGIVEKVTNAVTRDGRISDYQSCSITGTYNIRVLGSFLPESFSVAELGVDEEDAMKDYDGPLSAIPKQHHEILLTGAIAMAYKYPPKIDLNMASAFEQEFQLGIKKIKRHSRTRVSTGFIKPHEF